MTEIKLNNNIVVLYYTSIKELPIDLGKKFNQYILQDSGIGNSIEAVDEHLARLVEFISHDKKDDAVEELKNLRFNFFSMLSGWDFKSSAFACLIHSINNLPVTDRSEDGIEKIITHLSENGLTGEKVESVLEEVKKKWLQKSSSTSPSSLETTGST